MAGFGMRKFSEDFKREAVRLVQSNGPDHRADGGRSWDRAFDVEQMTCQAS